MRNFKAFGVESNTIVMQQSNKAFALFVISPTFHVRFKLTKMNRHYFASNSKSMMGAGKRNSFTMVHHENQPQPTLFHTRFSTTLLSYCFRSWGQQTLELLQLFECYNKPLEDPLNRH